MPHTTQAQPRSSQAAAPVHSVPLGQFAFLMMALALEFTTMLVG